MNTGFRSAFAALVSAVCHRLPGTLLLLPLLASAALAQTTTTVSGTVFDPRTTASSFPLPNILVYVTTNTPAPLPAGVQCLTTGALPTDAQIYTSTAVDGTFTLTGVPVNQAYTLVIQAGKWRRQWPLTVNAVPVTGLALHMPASRNDGDIPLIAIATGSADGFECVFHDMGIADTEFTDDNGVVNPGGRIHLYKGMSSPGADIGSTTPNESVLVSSATLLENYDVVMFPCQGGPTAKNSTELSNVLNYANSGGRIFTTHYSYDWLNPGAPYDSPFPPVANWSPNQNDPSPDPGIANVNTGFTDGATLGQWLYNAGATYKGLQGEIQVSTLRHDTTGVIAPTQSWLTMNSSSTGSGAVMQMTFNTPVGAPAANQCGRVLYNEYHVMNPTITVTGKAYPTECPTTTSMSAQEAMLEYALFDLSAFVQPVVVPTLTLNFAPSPLIVNQGDTADQVTITAANTSSSVAIDPSAVLTLTLPTGMTATAIADTSTTGGWSCTLATLTCTRTASIPSSTSDAVILTASVPAYPTGGLASYTGQITATVSSPTFSSNVVGTDTVIFQQTPVITWPAPASIIYGTALSGTQLNATTTVAGAFTYTPTSGAVPPVGTHSLSTTFTPTDTTHYTTATATNSITVLTATPTVVVSSNANPIFLSNPVTFTASVSSLGATPTGSVIFYDGATNIGTGTVSTSGAATFTTPSLTTGTHSITAVYSGDSTYNPATSAPFPQLIEDFTITVGGSGTANLGLGQNAIFPLTVSPVVGSILPGAITFAPTGMLPETSSSFSPASLTAGASSTVVYFNVSAASSFAATQPPPFGLSRALPLALGLLLLPFAARFRRQARRWQSLGLMVLASLAVLTCLTACAFNYTPKNNSVTVTATSGNLSHTATVKVTVQ